MKLLIVEDDPAVLDRLEALLEGEGYAVDRTPKGEEGRLLAFVNKYDGIVLDLSLGDRHGLTILTELRAEGVKTPVLVLTAHADTEMVVRALDVGADDYAVKGLPDAELVARVRALVRRGPAERSNEQLSSGNVVLNRLTQRVLVDGEPLELTQLEYRLLQEFLRQPGRVLTRSDLLERVWDRLSEPESNVVNVYISRLRKKLEAAGAQPTLVTVRGAGYSLQP